IAVSVVGASIGMFAKDGVFDNRGALAWIAAVVLVLGLGYFLLSGLLALSAYAVSPLHTPDLADRPEARGASSTDTVAADDDSSWRMTLLDCLDLNVFVAMNKSNRFSASIKLLRNGLASIFFFACLAIYSAVIQ